MGRHALDRGAARKGSVTSSEGGAVIDRYQAAAFALSDVIVDPAMPFQVLWRSESSPPPRGAAPQGKKRERQ